MGLLPQQVLYWTKCVRSPKNVVHTRRIPKTHTKICCFLGKRFLKGKFSENGPKTIHVLTTRLVKIGGPWRTMTKQCALVGPIPDQNCGVSAPLQCELLEQFADRPHSLYADLSTSQQAYKLSSKSIYLARRQYSNVPEEIIVVSTIIWTLCCCLANLVKYVWMTVLLCPDQHPLSLIVIVYIATSTCEKNTRPMMRRWRPTVFHCAYRDQCDFVN